MSSPNADQRTPLKRALSLPQLILYGLGTTVGAGIYALLGEISGLTGYLAPWSFIAAGLIATLTAISFAVLSSRYPRAAGIALYVQQGIGSERLALVVGLLAILAGVVSSAALLNGLVGYAQEFVTIGRLTLILGSAILVIGVASWGITESVWLAGTITVIEVGGLVWASALATQASTPSLADLAVFMPTDLTSAIPVVLSGAILAFYAYIGFEDMIEVAEEVKHVQRNLPIAIIVTLVATTLIYVMLVSTAILATSPEYLAQSSAPLADLFRAVSNVPSGVISAIALLAIINGALIQIIMASRILYGLSSRGQLPKVLSLVHARTRTPIFATFSAGSIVIVLAVSGTVASLAELTAIIILVLFTLVNLSLALLEFRASTGKRHWAIFVTASLGVVACAGMVLRSVLV